MLVPISLGSAIELILLPISVNSVAALTIYPIPRFLRCLHIISAFPRSAQLRPMTFSTDHDASGSVSTSDIPFPTLGDLKAEIVHLSFLF